MKTILPLNPLKPRPTGARKAPASVKRKGSEVQAEHSSMASAKDSPIPTSVAPSSHGFLKSFDGTRIFYSIEGKGKPLVFCYGLVCSSLHWTYQIEHFKKTHQVIWFDYRGHQNSDMPINRDSLTLNNLARDLGQILDHLKIPEAVILGHSMGVNVVLELFRQQPKRVAAMVLANGTAQRPLETLFRHNALQGGFQILKKAFYASPTWFSLLWKSQKSNPLARTLVSLGGFNPHLTPRADIELYIDQVAQTDPELLIRLIESYESYDATAWLHKIPVPTLILAGQQDRITPLEQQQLMAQLIPKSLLSVIPRGSHCPQMDLPELVNARIEQFLNQVGYGTSLQPPSPPQRKRPQKPRTPQSTFLRETP